MFFKSGDRSPRVNPINKNMVFTMRIKVVGKVTEEKLVNAFRIAQSQVNQLMDGAQFFGVNLYFSLYDEDGAHIDDQIELMIKPGPDEVVRPTVTGEALLKRQRASALAKQKREEDAIKRQQENAEFIERLNERRALRQKAIEQIDALNTVTESCLTHCEGEFLHLLNEVVRAVWDEVKPVEPHGKDRGKPLPMPVYAVHEGKLSIHKASMKKPRLLKNPIYIKADYSGEMDLIWKNSHWTEVCNRIAKLLEPMKKSLAQKGSELDCTVPAQ